MRIGTGLRLHRSAGRADRNRRPRTRRRANPRARQEPARWRL